jgi:peptide/nickel transport system permease protein
VQYWNYATGLLRGDWGRSIYTRRPVLQDLEVYLPATLELVTAAMVLAVVLGVPAGVVAAVYRDRWPDMMSRTISIGAISMPRFFLALLLQLAFAMWLGWLPPGGRLPLTEDPPRFVTGFLTIDGLLAGDLHATWLALQYLALPAFAICLSPLATITRMMRASTIDALRQDYVRTERAQGLRPRVILFKYVLRNAISATLTVIGLYIGWLVGGTVLVEMMFGLAGDRTLRDQCNPGAGFHAGHRRDAGDLRGVRRFQSRGGPAVCRVQSARAHGMSALTIRRAEWWRGWRRLRQSSQSMLGLIVVTCALMVALAAPLLAPYPHDLVGAVDTASRFQPPNAWHWFGTNEVGQDVLSLVIGEARVSLLSSIAVLALGTIAGVIVGACAGYFGGLIDEVLMRFTDLMLTVPSLILAMAVAAALGGGLGEMILAIALSWWPGYARLVRGEVVPKKQEQFVQAALAIGAGSGRILARHILPNIVSAVIVKVSLDIGFAILTVASLGFIGIGLKPPMPEWGLMLVVARSNLPDYWWTAMFPGLAIFATVYGFNLLGDGLRDMLDPRDRAR